MAEWRPQGEEDPAGAPLRRRRRRVAPHAPSAVDEEVFVWPEPRDKRAHLGAPVRTRPRYAPPVIATMDLAATLRYYQPREGAARRQGHELGGPGVMGPGTFFASCECGARLAPGELSAVITPCPRAKT